jgi:hypothetical protein
MHHDLERRLAGSWPHWFNTGGDIRSTAMSRGFEHGDGWFDILWRLCEDIEPLVKNLEQEIGCQFEVQQVKEKLGGLRIHGSHANDDICFSYRNRNTAIVSHLRSLWNSGKSAGRRLA